MKVSRLPVLFYGSVCYWCSILSCSVGQVVMSLLTREGTLGDANVLTCHKIFGGGKKGPASASPGVAKVGLCVLC